MPEGKKTAVLAPKPVREEDLYSAKTHLHQPVPVQETSAPSIRATARIRVKIFFIGICLYSSIIVCCPSSVLSKLKCL